MYHHHNGEQLALIMMIRNHIYPPRKRSTACYGSVGLPDLTHTYDLM